MEHPKSSDALQTSTVIQEKNLMKNQKRNYAPIRSNIYLIPKVKKRMSNYESCGCKLTDDQLAQGIKGCDNGCLNRMVRMECGIDCSLKAQCANKRFQNREYSKFEVVKTNNKGFGLISRDEISEGTFICEYIGEVINTEQLNDRKEKYLKQNVPYIYLMGLDSDTFIDAMEKGNESRFVNHSCDPNAQAQKWEVNREDRIGFFSIRHIKKGEEITIDYQLDNRGYGQKCYCESNNCQGWIGGKPNGSKNKKTQESEYTVKKVLDRRESKNKIEYLVKWKGFDSSKNSWVPERKINCDELIRFNENRTSRKKANKEVTREKSETRTVKSIVAKENLQKPSELKETKRCTSLGKPVSSLGCQASSSKNDNHSEYKVEKILDRWRSKKRTEYLVKWKGCDDSENSWVPEKNMNYDELIKLYKNTIPRKNYNPKQTREKSKTRTVKSNSVLKEKENLRKSREVKKLERKNPKIPSPSESASSQGSKEKIEEPVISSDENTEFTVQEISDQRKNEDSLEYLLKKKICDKIQNTSFSENYLKGFDLNSLRIVIMPGTNAETEDKDKKQQRHTMTIVINLENSDETVENFQNIQTSSAMDQTKIVENIVKTVETQIDREIEMLDTLGGSDLERIRHERLAALKKNAEQRLIWQSLGHGEYLEVDEKDFFNVTKKSNKVVAHFYKSDAPRCKIFDHHLKIIAPKHMETRFLKLDAEKCPFLTGRLNISVIPTLLVVIDNVTKDKIVGFTELGNCDDFSTEMLEWRLGVCTAINYEGDLLHPPEKTKTNQKIKRIPKKNSTIRGRESDNSDSD